METQLEDWQSYVKFLLEKEEYEIAVSSTINQLESIKTEDNPIPVLLDIVQSYEKRLQVSACVFLAFLAIDNIKASHVPKIMAVTKKQALKELRSGGTSHMVYATSFVLMQYGDEASTELLEDFCSHQKIDLAELPKKMIAMAASL